MEDTSCVYPRCRHESAIKVIDRWLCQEHYALECDEREKQWEEEHKNK